MSIIDYKIFSFLNAFQLVLKKSGNKLWYYISIVYLYTQYTGITYLISRFIFVFAESRVFGSSRTLEALSTPVRCSLKYWFVDQIFIGLKNSLTMHFCGIFLQKAIPR